MSEMKRLNLILGILAAVILVSSCTVFAYTLIPQGDTTKLVVNGVDYTRNDIFTYFGSVGFEANDQTFEGVRLSDIIIETGLPNAASHDFRISASDRYQKDVSWDDMVNGYLVEDEYKTVFPELARQFWVKDVVSIEVI
jgi:hypothetical protein